jgi:membrane-associated phospholipid phosphatase
MAGKHFPADVIAGAAVGTAAGFLVPALHKSPSDNIRPAVSGGTLGLAFNWM